MGTSPGGGIVSGFKSEVPTEVLAAMPAPAVLIAEIRRVASESPEIRVKQCRYVRDFGADDSGRCLVGVALVRLGVRLPWDKRLFDDCRSAEFQQVNSSGIASLYGYETPVDDEDRERWPAEIRWLSRVQSNQDLGHVWGDAIVLADGEEPPMGRI